MPTRFPPSMGGRRAVISRSRADTCAWIRDIVHGPGLRPVSLRLDAECETCDLDFLVGADFDALLARYLAPADEGRVAPLGAEPVAARVVEFERGVVAADLRVAFYRQVNGDGLRAATDCDLVLGDGHDRLAHAAPPDLDAVEFLRSDGDLRHFAFGLLRVRGRGRLLTAAADFGGPSRDHRVSARLARLPDGLHAELALVARAVN